MNKTRLLKIGCAALALAVLAGITESVVAIATLMLHDALPPQWPLQIGVRLVVYTLALVLVGLTWQRRRFARPALLILLGVLGLGSMVVPMIGQLAAGESLPRALGADTSMLFPPIRAAHILLVVVGAVALIADLPTRSPEVQRSRSAARAR
ncbi:MAG TPA: hypothetical protein VIP98_09250 [Microlunatus sp.]